MFCPVCGNEENEPMHINGTKVCHKCGCVIEKAAPVAKPRNPHTPVLVLSIISIPFLLFFVVGSVAEKSFDNSAVLSYVVFYMQYSFYLLSAVYLVITKTKNQNISFCKIIGVLFILLSLIYAVFAIYGLTKQHNNNEWLIIIQLVPLFIYTFLHGVCLIRSNHNTFFEKLSIVLLIVSDIIGAFHYSGEKLKFEPVYILTDLLIVFPLALIHIAFILHFKQSEKISKN